MECVYCNKRMFARVYEAGEGFSSPVCIDCLEKLIKDNKIYWCIYHKRYELYEEGKLVHKAKIGDKKGYICNSVRHKFTECEECGEITYNENIYDGLCKDCKQKQDTVNSYIGLYHEQHDLPKKFYGNPSNGIFFGLEIESEYAYGKIDVVDIFSKSTRTLCCFEEDSSLDDGFETITNPLSYEFMRSNKVIEQITSELEEEMMITSNCGLHIHVTKTDEVTEKLPQIIMFLENNKEDVIKFCERETSYAEFYTYKDKKINPYIANEIILNSDSFGRRRMINLTNKNTIEFRGFRGTLDPNKIYRYIEFILALLETNIDENTTFEDLVIPDLFNHA